MDMGLTAKASLPGAVRGLRGTGTGLGVGWTPDFVQRPSTPKAENWGSQSSRVEERERATELSDGASPLPRKGHSGLSPSRIQSRETNLGPQGASTPFFPPSSNNTMFS